MLVRRVRWEPIDKEAISICRKVRECAATSLERVIGKTKTPTDTNTHTSTMTGVSPLHPFLQHVLDVPTSAATLLVPTYPIAWHLDPPSQPLCVLANALSYWMRTHNPQHTFLTYSDVERLRRLCALPTSILTPLFHALAMAFHPPSMASVYPAQTALRHRFASLGDTRGWAAPRWSVATPPRVDRKTDVWARVPNAGSVEVDVSVAGESHPSRATIVPVARDAVAREAALASLLRRPSLKQRVARHLATAVRSLKTSCARATQRLLEAVPAHDTTAGTYTNSTHPPPVIQLVDVVDRVCMQTLTSRTHPVVLHWTRQAMTAAGTAETEDVRLIRYTPGAVDTQGRPTECRIRRLAKTGSSAYKSVSVRTLAFPSGSTLPVPKDGQWAPVEKQTASITRRVNPDENRYGVLPRPSLVTTTPIVPPPRADMVPALSALVDMPMRTDAPLQTPHHVGRLYVQMGTLDVIPVGIYTESRLDDGTTLRLYTFEREPDKVYTHRSRRRTDGVRM